MLLITYLKVDNATRWNSLYEMIKRAIKLKDRIDLFCLHNQEAMYSSSTKKALIVIEKEHLLKYDILTEDD